ncbi:OsmC family protein [Alkalilimnicola ehrlichii MLHE-1]|uniref:OsmC family protein n=1 Tax=Alkalilimnicola ehrlichii (strain ATCC BAA-1101 / DSM 17681 / MLHE-1) TaxID=187272 RepID=Q0A6F0_ALKEH|nr:OsmC family protein [Alkalilimnicola ehrlichii]ABI57587.1 OsmC family protein [Alkalilimnicola ehrlichii MLHE-1]
MKASVKWLGNAAFEAETGSGHTLVMDGPADAGGENRGPRPMEMLLLGTAGCSAFDVVHILQRGRHPVADCQVRVEAERAEQPPKVFTRIHLHFQVAGEGLSEKAVARAVQLSAEKYCSASIMLSKAAKVTHSHELV